MLLAASDNRGVSLIYRLLPDSDRQLANPVLAAGEFKASLLTQPGHTYQVRSRPALDAAASSPVAKIIGDGYRSEVGVPSSGREGFLELRQE